MSPYCRQRTRRRRTASLLLCVAVLHAPVVARAAEPVSYAVNARIHVDEGVVVGAMHADVLVGAGEEHIRLWLLPDRLAVVPSEMDDRSARWIFPGEVDLGGIRVTDVRIEGAGARTRVVRRPAGEARGRDAAGADLLVSVVPGPERRVDLRLRFVVALPQRFGRLGRADGRLSLAAPWYPLVVGEGDAYRYDVPHRVRVQTTSPVELMVGDRRVRPGEPVEQRAAWLPVIAAEHMYVCERTVDGVRMRMIATEPFYEAPTRHDRGLEALSDLVRIDVVSLAASALADVVATLRDAGVPLPRRDLTLVSIPSRTELAATAPGIVVYSDRLYEVFPIEQTREFHHRALRRAMFATLLAPLVRRVESPRDRGWATDLRSVLLTDVDDARRHGRARTPEDLIGFAAFHPAVDQLLYAPQVAFADVYFGAIEEPDPFRESPYRARFAWARGRRILESARDALSKEAFASFAQRLLAFDESARDALHDVAPDLADRLPQWLVAPTLDVNYRLADVSSERLPGGGFRHRVVIVRDGAERIEPVEVRVEDEDGNVETATWDGEGSHGVVEIETPAPLGDVVVDPRERLPQSPALTSGHPRGDDATTRPWKPPLLRGFGLNLVASEGRLEGFLDFAMRRRYDLEHTLAGIIVHRASATTGGVRYIHGIGPKRHSNARIGSASIGLDVDRLHGGFGGGDGEGWRLSLVTSAGFDTRSFFQDPRQGSSLVGTAQVGGVRRDGGGFGVTAALDVRGSLTFPIGLRNALVLVAGAGWTFGDALFAEHQRLGGRLLLRGFEVGELVGDGRVWAVAEHRWTAWSDMAWNVLHLAWLREIQLAVFAGAGLLLSPVGLDGPGSVGLRDAVVAAELGGGLRFHYEYGGVQPAVLSIDVAVPLTRKAQGIGSDGVPDASRPPVGVHLAFDQFF